MKANELRIGNLVIYLTEKEDDEVVAPILSLSFDDEPDESVNDIYKPIPLTEEWVIKFGFKDGGQSSKIYSIFKISKSQESGYDVHVGNEFVKITKQETKVHLEYVHQLQNLYFALTGEELIKENK